MIYRLTAEPLSRPRCFTGRPPALDCTWDSEAGTLKGQGADALQLVVERVRDLGRGRAPHPYIPADSIDAPDPLHQAADMAVVVCANWTLPDALASSMPPREGYEDDNDPDALF